ncbi:MAG: hypothetical protein RLZZ58_274 [Pseudomonadota bacterium]|jgi:hypothetical protein
MRTQTILAILAAAGGAATLSACAPAGTAVAGAEALTPKQAALLDKNLAGKVAGEAVSCLPSGPSTTSIRVSDNILLYRVSGRLVYRNDLRGSCPGLARDDDVMVVEVRGGQTCRGDFFHLVDRSSGIRGPTCVFGEFVPYRKPRGDES